MAAVAAWRAGAEGGGNTDSSRDRGAPRADVRERGRGQVVREAGGYGNEIEGEVGGSSERLTAELVEGSVKPGGGRGRPARWG